MTVGIVMLVHRDLDRAEQVARHWMAAGCPVALHVDREVSQERFQALHDALAGEPLIRFCERSRCEWGTWGIVAATQSASDILLTDFPEATHVYLTSGSCLPLQPVRELKEFLAARPNTDFIESAMIADVSWPVGGLDIERFTLRFPFSWKKHRRLFDRYVTLQRRLRVRRRIPDGLVPHLGSQWWCLSRQTLSAILRDPERPRYERYFRRVWIPDEGYFQTLVRRHSSTIENRSLTLSKFDRQGKPHVFYDDHLSLLHRSDRFVARKIWPGADRLYQAFLGAEPAANARPEPIPGRIDRVFAKAAHRRTRGRPGLYMQSRMPVAGRENGVTAGPYSVFYGFAELYRDFEPWLAKVARLRVHGHLYAPEGVHFENRAQVFAGGLHAGVAQRDYAPESFLTNLIWNTRGERQCFQFGPADNQAIAGLLGRDRNARLSVISGAWAVPLLRSNRPLRALQQEAAQLQATERRLLAQLRAETSTRVRIWTLAEFLQSPLEHLEKIVEEFRLPGQRRLAGGPVMNDLTGLEQFMRSLTRWDAQPQPVQDAAIETFRIGRLKAVRGPFAVQVRRNV